MASTLALLNVRGHWAGRRSLTEALDRAGAQTPNEARATALVRLGAVALHQGDYAAARPRLEEALALCRQRSDERGEVRALGTLGIVALYQGDIDAARVAFEEALALYRKQNDAARGGAHNLAPSRDRPLRGGQQSPRGALALFLKVGTARRPHARNGLARIVRAGPVDKAGHS
jgi:tetratricopeptide (TPR) repeat protein